MKFIKYFFEFISIISLFSIFKIIGLRNASNLGSFLGRLIGPLFRSKNIIMQNIKTGLGEIDKKREYEIINDMWSNIGRTFAEYVFLKDFRLNRTNFDHMKINGVKYLNEIKRYYPATQSLIPFKITMFLHRTYSLYLIDPRKFTT